MIRRAGRESDSPSAARRLAASVAWVVCVGALLVGCSASSTLHGQAAGDDIERAADVFAAHEALVAAFEAGDVDAFVGLLEPSPRLLIYHPRLVHRYTGIDQIRASMPKMFARLHGASWTDAHTEVHVNGDVAWLTSHVLLEAPGLAEPFVGRGTEIWVRSRDGWHLAHAHWSPNPEAPSHG
jgi:ketosteroid isomerase-like protein